MLKERGSLFEEILARKVTQVSYYEPRNYSYLVDVPDWARAD